MSPSCGTAAIRNAWELAAAGSRAPTSPARSPRRAPADFDDLAFVATIESRGDPRADQLAGAPDRIVGQVGVALGGGGLAVAEEGRTPRIFCCELLSQGEDREVKGDA